MSATHLAFPPARIVRHHPCPAPSRMYAIVAALERLASNPSTRIAGLLAQRL